MMTAAPTFGGWLKRRRLSLGLTQKELARQVGYAQVTLRKVEADELRPSGQMARKLAEALEFAPEEQTQFVRFARDEAHWDDLALPERGPLASLPAAQLPEQQQPLTIQQPAAIAAERRRTRHNLPALTTALIGRDEELAELAQLLADAETRLITILSAGGVGKTSLAIAAAQQQAEQFSDGVCWVPLAPLTEAKELVLAIAAALGLQLQGERTPEQQVGDFLRTKHLLLVLDNFEHLLAGTTLVCDLLVSAPQLSVLITSRQRLNLSSETVVFLDGLRFPADRANKPLSYPAVQLFVLHARRLDHHYQPDETDMAGIIEVCRLVHGMPLGILLAAAWSRVLAPAAIAAEIGRDLGLLQTDMADVPTRQRNLRTVFLHTWNRLSAAARHVFMCLSVFRGGASTEAARQVTGATVDVLAELIDMALLRRLPNGRYEIHELLRQFAAEELAGSTNEDVLEKAQQQHSRYFLNLLATLECPLQGPQQSAALDAIRTDYENISSAWRWAVREREFALLVPAVHALFLFCEVRGDFQDGLILFADAAAALTKEANSGSANEMAPGPTSVVTLQPILGQVLVRLGASEVMVSNYRQGERMLQDGYLLITDDCERAFTLAYLGLMAGEQSELALARTRLHESLELCRRCDDTAGMARALFYLQYGESDYAEALRLCTECLALAHEMGRPDLIAGQLNQMGWHKWCLGDYDGADLCWRDGIALCDELKLHTEKAWVLDCMGLGAWVQGDMAAAERYIEDALALYTELGRQMAMGMCMADLTLILVSQGKVQQALALAQKAVTLTRETDSQMMLVVSLTYQGAALLADSEPGKARHVLLEAVKRAWSHQHIFSLMIAFYYAAELLALECHNAVPHEATNGIYNAVMLLTCVRKHSATWKAFKDKAEQLQSSIEAALPAIKISTAIQRGTSQTVEQMVQMLLASNLGEITLAPHQPSIKGGSARSADASSELFEPLTGRELAVLYLMAAGASNQDIAAELVITQGTAKWYVSQILGKLCVQSRTQAVARARELGLLA